MKWFVAILFPVIVTAAFAADRDTIGLTLLRQTDPFLTGTGVPVTQAEGTTGGTDFEVNPSTVGQPAGLFTWESAAGTATNFPNVVGVESFHADAVGQNFFGTNGMAPGVSHVENIEADYFYNSMIATSLASFAGKVVNQSFVADTESAMTDQNYDDYAVQHNTLFVTAAGNFGPVLSPATAYNGLAVGVYGASSSVGPTANGRCKPDITAPGGATSFSAPYVAGAAALLLQAANRGDGGPNITAASDMRTVKALLLNGAVKPGDWTNSAAHPLDLRYGAGILNVFNSWKQMGAGMRSFVEATSNSSGGAHPPGSNTNNVPLVGWDFSAITNSKTGPNFQDRVHHYYFNVDATNGSSFAFTATLAWNRESGAASVKDLNLFLYQMNGTLVASSTSSVDNVEHVFQTKLSPGRYDLQVVKSGSGASQSTSTETYAVAFEAFAMKLNVARTDNSIVISWPVSPSGFTLQATSDLGTTWTNVPSTVVVSNGFNVVAVPAGGSRQFFRLQRP